MPSLKQGLWIAGIAIVAVAVYSWAAPKIKAKVA